MGIWIALYRTRTELFQNPIPQSAVHHGFASLDVTLALLGATVHHSNSNGN